MLSSHVLGSPGGYPVFLQRWTRMGQTRDTQLDKLLLLGEPEAVVTFFPPVDIDTLGDRKKLAEFCFRQVSSAVQAANSGRYELLPPPRKAA